MKARHRPSQLERLSRELISTLEAQPELFHTHRDQLRFLALVIRDALDEANHAELRTALINLGENFSEDAARDTKWTG